MDLIEFMSSYPAASGERDQTTFLSEVWRTQRNRKKQTRYYPVKNAGDRCSMLLRALSPLASCFLHVGPPRKPRLSAEGVVSRVKASTAQWARALNLSKTTSP